MCVMCVMCASVRAHACVRACMRVPLGQDERTPTGRSELMNGIVCQACPRAACAYPCQSPPPQSLPPRPCVSVCVRAHPSAALFGRTRSRADLREGGRRAEVFSDVRCQDQTLPDWVAVSLCLSVPLYLTDVSVRYELWDEGP
jgi:hypothetical protein